MASDLNSKYKFKKICCHNKFSFFYIIIIIIRKFIQKEKVNKLNKKIRGKEKAEKIH